MSKYKNEISQEDKDKIEKAILTLLVGIPLRDVKVILEDCTRAVSSCSVLQDDYVNKCFITKVKTEHGWVDQLVNT